MYNKFFTYLTVRLGSQISQIWPPVSPVEASHGYFAGILQATV